MTIYLLHFDRPYQRASHYLGYCEAHDPADRIERHRSGHGSPLVKAVLAAGINVRLAHVIPGADRNFERKLKKRKAVNRWCPCCGKNTRPIPVFKMHTHQAIPFGSSVTIDIHKNQGKTYTLPEEPSKSLAEEMVRRVGKAPELAAPYGSPDALLTEEEAVALRARYRDIYGAVFAQLRPGKSRTYIPDHGLIDAHLTPAPEVIDE